MESQQGNRQGESGPRKVTTLQIWQEGMDIVEGVYQLSSDWPKAEIYGLTSQARRAAVSIPANLAEGVGRGSPAEMSRFAKITLGSSYELYTLLILAERLKYSESNDIQRRLAQIEQLNRRVNRFIQYQEGKK